MKSLKALVLAFVVGCEASHAAPAPGAPVREPEPVRDVRRPLGDHAVVDWSALTVEATAWAMDPMWKGDNKPLEQQAMSAIDGRIGQLVARVPVDGKQSLGDVRPRVAAEAATGWVITEGRYYADGPVEIVGRVELQPLLSLWSSQRAAVMPATMNPVAPAPPPTPPPTDAKGKPKKELLDASQLVVSSGPTGVVIDARGLGVEPVYAPRVVDLKGAELYAGVLWRDAAYDHPPAVWIADPVHPAAAAAGADPAFFVAASGGLGEIVLSDADAARFRAEVSPSPALGEGTVVIVVDAN